MIEKNTPLNEILKLGKSCQQCSHCCSYTSGFATEEDMIKIAHKMKMTAAQLKKDYFEEIERFGTRAWRPNLIKLKGKPYGRCIFLKGKDCSIHDVKPLHCKIMNCSELGEQISQWYDLNYFVDKKNKNSLREWASVVQVKKPIKGGSMQELVPNKTILKEILGLEE